MAKPQRALPELPPLKHDDTDVILEAFCHKSILMQYDPENATNNLRLIELGKSALQYAITYQIYTARPIIEVHEMPVREESLSFELALNGYSVMHRLEGKNC